MHTGSADKNVWHPALDCNNTFGSRFEPQLQNWHDSALDGVRFSGEAVPGSRRVGRVLLRENHSGEPVLFMDGKAPGVRELLEHGQLAVEYLIPDDTEVRIAALKTVYLACCLILGRIPTTAKARAIRRELVEARGLPRNRTPEPSDLLRSLSVTKTGHGPIPGETHIVASRVPDGSIGHAISFNGCWAVSWPLEPGWFVFDDGITRRVLGSNLPPRRTE